MYSDPVAVAQKLIDAYKSGNKKPFDYFFQSWHEWSAQVDSVEQDSKTKFIDSIFQMVYFPFDFKKYGWKNRIKKKARK